MRLPYNVLTAVYCAGIFWMSSQPRLPRFTHVFRHEDKLLHAAVYAGLAVLVSYGLRYSERRVRPVVQFCVPVLFAGLYGLSDEFHQTFVPNRCFDAADLLADVSGALLVQWVLCFRVWRLGRRGP